MRETDVMYVSSQMSVNVLRMEAMAMRIGMTTAGRVPKTKSRMIVAPMPPISASVSTLGPSLSPPSDS
jgi:hypothetical protein